MKRATLLFTSGLTAAMAMSSAQAAGLDALLWKARPVVVFVPGLDDPAALDQIGRLRKDRAALDDRDMPVFVVAMNSVTTLAGGRAPATLEAGALRRAYRIADGAFAIILVGKDGGEKFRASEPVAAGRLIGLVDDMPMRRREAR